MRDLGHKKAQEGRKPGITNHLSHKKAQKAQKPGITNHLGHKKAQEAQKPGIINCLNNGKALRTHNLAKGTGFAGLRILFLIACFLLGTGISFAERKAFAPSFFFSQRGHIWDSVNKVAGELGMQFYLMSTTEEKYTSVGTLEFTFRVSAQGKITQANVSKFCDLILESFKINLLDCDCRRIRWLPSGVIYRGDLNLGNIIISVSKMTPDSFTFLVMIYEWLPN